MIHTKNTHHDDDNDEDNDDDDDDDVGKEMSNSVIF